jgi:hypothetical protein
MSASQLTETSVEASIARGRTTRHGRLEAASAPALAVLGLTVIGVVLRVIVARQSIFGDELSTYWIVEQHGLGGVVSLIYGSAAIHHAEITPPMYFVAAWFTTRLGHALVWLRAPSLIAGTLTIPVIYMLGTKLADRRAALVATALATLSPFMIFYSTEARAYGVLMLLVAGSTLAMLLALENGRRRWWAAYALCTCAGVYTHFTCLFVFAAQFGWLLWAHREAVRPALIANLCALAGMLPWTAGFIRDFNSPTVSILSALSPFDGHQIPIILGHWAIGYPYANSISLTTLPGPVALVLLAVCVVIAFAALVRRVAVGGGVRTSAGLDRKLVLVIVLALATPVGEAIVSVFSTHIFGVRNLASSWPGLGIGFAILLTAAPRRWRACAVGLALASFAIAAGLMLTSADGRPEYKAAAGLIAQRARPGDVVIDETGNISPGPLTPLDIYLHSSLPVFRAQAPTERSHPFGFADPVVPLAAAVRSAVATAHGARIFVVSTSLGPSGITELDERTRVRAVRLPVRYRLVGQHVYPGIAHVRVQIYSARPSPP